MKFSEQVLLEMRLVRAKACAVTGDCHRARVNLLQLFFVYFLSPLFFFLKKGLLFDTVTPPRTDSTLSAGYQRSEVVIRASHSNAHMVDRHSHAENKIR